MKKHKNYKYSKMKWYKPPDGEELQLVGLSEADEPEANATFLNMSACEKTWIHVPRRFWKEGKFGQDMRAA